MIDHVLTIACFVVFVGVVVGSIVASGRADEHERYANRAPLRERARAEYDAAMQAEID